MGTDADGKTLTKKFHNAYGVHLAKLLDKDNFKLDRREAEPDKCKAEVQAALDKVEKMKVDPTDPNSPTWGDLLKQGKLSSTDVVEKK